MREFVWRRNVAHVKPITNAHEYETALARIDRLMGAEPGTAEGRELDLLADLVEMYEDENEPMGRPDPETAIEFRREQIGTSCGRDGGQSRPREGFRSAGDDSQAGSTPLTRRQSGRAP